MTSQGRRLAARIARLETRVGTALDVRQELEALCDAHLLAVLEGLARGVVYENIGSPALRQQLRTAWAALCDAEREALRQ